MYIIAFAVMLTLYASASPLQDPRSANPSEPLSGEQMFSRWLNRFNALDDWSISLTGEEEPEVVVKAFVDLYAPDAVQFVGPEENQIGLVTLSGQEAIRQWADRTARKHRDIALRIMSRTLDERTASLFVAEAPWGGASISTELTYAYTDRYSLRRFQIPGTVVIDFGNDGKIRRLRLYLVTNEKEEIYPYDYLAGGAAPIDQPAGEAPPKTSPPERDGMSLIGTGEFWMGRVHSFPLYEWGMMQRARLDDKPAHKVNIDAFYIDKFEVMNRDYKEFVDATKRQPPWHWPGGTFPSGEERLPVTNVTWADADEYCKWAGKRLPTEAEWEKAARGGLDRQLFAWGNTGIRRTDGDGKTTATGLNAHVRIASGPAPVGSYPPNSYNLYDMAGNVWEWVSDWYLRDYYSISPDSNPQGPNSGTYKVIRGAGWSDPEDETVLVSYRNYSRPEQRSFTIGFRCAIDGAQK